MELLKPGLGLIFFVIIAFALLLFILGRYAWPAIIKGLSDREDSIADSLASAEKVKLEMAQLKADNEKLLAQAREERAQLLKEAKEARDKMIIEAKEDAKVQASKIIAEAQDTIHQQKMAAITDIKNQVGNLVIGVSEKVLRRELNQKQDQEQFIRRLSDEMQMN